MDYLSGNGDRISVPDPVSTRLESRICFKLQGISRFVPKGTDFAFGFQSCCQGNDV